MLADHQIKKARLLVPFARKENSHFDYAQCDKVYLHPQNLNWSENKFALPNP